MRVWVQRRLALALALFLSLGGRGGIEAKCFAGLGCKTASRAPARGCAQTDRQWFAGLLPGGCNAIHPRPLGEGGELSLRTRRKRRGGQATPLKGLPPGR